MIQELTLNTMELRDGLTDVAHALTARPIQPIYNGVHVAADGNRLTLTVTDGELTIRRTVDCADVAQDGEAVYPARLLIDLIRHTGAADVKLSVDDKNLAKITCEGSKTSVVCMNAEDFPHIADVEDGREVTLPAGKLRNAISRVMFAVSTDESRKVLTGVLTEIYAKETRLVSIDGFRMALMTVDACNDIPTGNDMLKLVLPGRFMAELSKLLPDDDTPVKLAFDGARAKVSFGDIEILTVLLTGEFIDYRKIMQGGALTEAIIRKDRMMPALERCGLIAREAGKGNLITMDVGDDGINMHSRAERGDVREEVPAEMSGDKLTISFNSDYLTDVVRNIAPEEFRMCMNGPVSACVFRPMEGDEFTFLVLPVRTL